MGAIYSNWRQLKRVPPVIETTNPAIASPFTFSPKKSYRKSNFFSRLTWAYILPKTRRRLFAQVWREGQIWPLEARAVTGLSSTDTDAILNHLVVQRLIEQREGLQGRHYVLAAPSPEICRTKPEPAPVAAKER